MERQHCRSRRPAHETCDSAEYSRNLKKKIHFHFLHTDLDHSIIDISASLPRTELKRQEVIFVTTHDVSKQDSQSSTPLFLPQMQNVQECQKACDELPECKYFTWRAGDPVTGMFAKFCFMLPECGDYYNFECRDCYTGPRTDLCPLRRRNI